MKLNMQLKFRKLIIPIVKITLPVLFILISINSLSHYDNSKIRVGIYCDGGVGFPNGDKIKYVDEYEIIIKTIDKKILPFKINSDDISNGALDKTDVIVFPGGSGDGQARSLGKRGRKSIIDFVANGGGYVGICAGAYLAQHTNLKFPEFPLKLANARLYNKALYWNRGAAMARVSVTNIGRKMFPELRNRKYIYMHYNQGPVLVPADSGNVKYDELLKFKSNVYHNRPESFGETPGKTFLLKTKMGKGVVILMSGHPEATPGFRWMLPRMIRLAAKKKIVNYPKKYVKPLKYKREIMFDKRWLRKEKNLLKILSNHKEYKSSKIIDAIKKLKKMASRKITENVASLLISRHSIVRIKAAEIMIYYDYFPALHELEKVYSFEKNSGAIKAFGRAIKHLKSN
ncbi:BPL-N domain-containing protein [Spirochaetota bacterium]